MATGAWQRMQTEQFSSRFTPECREPATLRRGSRADDLNTAISGLAVTLEKVPIAALSLADSPRVLGEDGEHTKLLAGVDTALPPIVVYRPTMRVIDGMHRLRAAALRGNEDIEVVFYDGDEADTFVLAVELNRAHGLPLSRADRTAAATRIIESHPEWSHRRIAEVSGVSSSTVASIRRRSTAQNGQLNARVGRDGRVRPTDSAEGRLRASEEIERDPSASLRQIAKVAGVSLGTASSVRSRLHRGEPPVPSRERGAERPDPQHRGDDAEVGVVIVNLRRDPSLRFTETGRVLLRYLEVCAIGFRQWDKLIANVPVHQREAVARLARECAGAWETFANRLACQIDDEPSQGPRSA